MKCKWNNMVRCIDVFEATKFLIAVWPMISYYPISWNGAILVRISHLTFQHNHLCVCRPSHIGIYIYIMIMLVWLKYRPSHRQKCVWSIFGGISLIRILLARQSSHSTADAARKYAQSISAIWFSAQTGKVVQLVVYAPRSRTHEYFLTPTDRNIHIQQLSSRDGSDFGESLTFFFRYIECYNNGLIFVRRESGSHLRHILDNPHPVDKTRAPTS